MGEKTTISIDARVATGCLAAGLVIIGSLGPWVSVGIFSRNGISDGGDGLLTLFAGLSIFGLIAFVRSTAASVVTLLLSIGALAVGVYDANEVSSSGNELFEASVGWGLIAVLIGGAGALVWALVDLWVRGRVNAQPLTSPEQ